MKKGPSPEQPDFACSKGGATRSKPAANPEYLAEDVVPHSNFTARAEALTAAMHSIPAIQTAFISTPEGIVRPGRKPITFIQKLFSL